MINYQQHQQPTSSTLFPISGQVFITTTQTSNSTVIFQCQTGTNITGAPPVAYFIQGGNIPPGLEAGCTYGLPDGSKLTLDDLGNYKIEDKDAKITYKACNIRAFNPYISASDLLEHFLDDVGELGDLDQMEILKVPIEAFINWLILKAAERDGDSVEGLSPVQAALPPPTPKRELYRCGSCGRFLKKSWAAARITFCTPEHMRHKLLQLEYSAPC